MLRAGLIRGVVEIDSTVSRLRRLREEQAGGGLEWMGKPWSWQRRQLPHEEGSGVEKVMQDMDVAPMSLVMHRSELEPLSALSCLPRASAHALLFP